MFMQKEWCAIKLIDYFFILLIINSFVFFYSIYTFFEMKIFHNKQGSKLNIKKHSMNRRWFTVKRILFTLGFMAFLCYIGYIIFSPLYTSEHIIIHYGLNPFDICTEQPRLWQYCQYWFIFTYLFTSFFITNCIFHLLCKLSIKVFHFPITKKPSKTNFKKEKPSYSLISPSLSSSSLNLLIRRKWNNKRINLSPWKKFIPEFFNYRNYWNWEN